MSKMDVNGTLAIGLETNPRVCRCIPIAEVDNAILLSALRLWENLKGAQRFPSRGAVTPRILKPILRNTTLLKVIDGGIDYEYRIVGDAYVMAHGQSFQGLRWSATATKAPEFHKFIKPIYDRVVAGGEPLAMRGWIQRGGFSTGQVFCEYIHLPLGGEGAGVEYILDVAVYLRRDGLDNDTVTPSSTFTI